MSNEINFLRCFGIVVCLEMAEEEVNKTIQTVLSMLLNIELILTAALFRSQWRMVVCSTGSFW